MNDSGNSKKKRGRKTLRYAFMIASVAFILVSLQLASKIQGLSSDVGAVESSLRNFAKNKTQFVPINAEKDEGGGSYQASIYKLIDRSKRVEVPDKDRKLAFVHIGKSGGSTISLLLRNGCMSAVEGESCEDARWTKFPGKVGEKETVASQRIKFYLHTQNVDSGKMAEYYSRISSVVIVARDPLDRWISAFLSRHPDNMDTTRLINRAANIRAKLKRVPPPLWAQKTVFSIDGVRKDQIHRVSYNGCYPNVQEFVNCATGLPIKTEVYRKRIMW